MACGSCSGGQAAKGLGRPLPGMLPASWGGQTLPCAERAMRGPASLRTQCPPPPPASWEVHSSSFLHLLSSKAQHAHHLLSCRPPAGLWSKGPVVTRPRGKGGNWGERSLRGPSGVTREAGHRTHSQGPGNALVCQGYRQKGAPAKQWTTQPTDVQMDEGTT